MYRFNILLFHCARFVLCFYYKKDLHTVVDHFGFLKWIHHSCHGYCKKMDTSYFFQWIIYLIQLGLTKVCKPFQVTPTCNNMLSRIAKNCHIIVHRYPTHFLQHCYVTESPKLLTIPSLYSHGAILPSTS